MPILRYIEISLSLFSNSLKEKFDHLINGQLQNTLISNNNRTRDVYTSLIVRFLTNLFHNIKIIFTLLYLVMRQTISVEKRLNDEFVQLMNLSA